MPQSHAYPVGNYNADTHRNADNHAYCEPECDTQPEPLSNTYSHTYFNSAITSHTATTAKSKALGSDRPVSELRKLTVDTLTPKLVALATSFDAKEISFPRPAFRLP
jgi:hypothetical protein